MLSFNLLKTTLSFSITQIMLRLQLSSSWLLHSIGWVTVVMQPLEDVACLAGCGEGLVINYTDWCFTAIESLHDLFVHCLTPAEKEIEKRWMDENIGFRGKWRDGWLMYDGTIVVLFQKPGLNGNAYYTRKGNYGLNVQV